MFEPFRYLVYRSILETENQINKRDYAFSKDRIVIMSNESKKKYVDTLSNILDSKRLYKARAGIRRADEYQKMEEITIMKQKCIELRDFIQSNNKAMTITPATTS